MPKKNKPKPATKQLIKALDGLVNWSDIFPRKGRPDLRHNKFSKHTEKRVLAIYEDLAELGGIKKFKPQRASKKKELLQRATGTPEYFRGYFSAEELSVNYKRREVIYPPFKINEYQMGNVIVRPFSSPPLTVEELRHYLAELVKNPPKGAVNVGIKNTGSRYGMVSINEPERFIDKAAADYEKYSEMAKRGEKRANNKGKAAHPSIWMNGAAFFIRGR